MKPQQWTEKLKWRYATKQFDPNKTIDTETWQSIEDSLVLTPSSFGLQPWKFIIITDPAVKQKLLPHSWNQHQVVDCSHLVVLLANTNINQADVDKFIDFTQSVRGGDKDTLGAYKDMMSGFISRMEPQQKASWAKKQVYIALGLLLATAAALGVDACPMEGIAPAEYDKILKLTDTGFTTVLTCPLGYRSADDKYAGLAKLRYPKSELITHI